MSEQRGEGRNKIITLVPESWAKPGFTFVFRGSADICEKCRLKKVCIDNLNRFVAYRVVGVRDISHFCELSKQNYRVVEVEVAPVKLVLPAKQAVEGVKVVYSKPQCREYSCPYIHYCVYSYVPDGAKIRVVKVLNHIKCRYGDHALVEAVVEEV